MIKARVTVCVEFIDGTVKYKTFSKRGTIRSLKSAIRKRFAQDSNVAHVGLGNGIYSWDTVPVFPYVSY